jgi:hypothetical protein
MQADDSVTGQTLARVVDTQQGLDTGRRLGPVPILPKRRIIGLWAQAVVRGLTRSTARQ